MTRQRIVIIGNGIAGNSVASAARTYDRDADITVISNETQPLYSPCAFPKCLSGEMEKQKLFLKTINDYKRDEIKVVFGQEVSAVNVNTQEVSAGGRRIPFDKLVLATGSKALMPPIKGIDKRGVFPLKTINDLEAILAWPGTQVAIVGSGPIGIEMAIAFRMRGLEVSVIEILPHLLPRLFDDEPALMIRKIIEEHGIKVFMDEKVTQILGNEVVEGLATDKRKIESDTVIIAAGVRPNTDIAKQIGLELGNFGGIITDDYMMTSIENIYACGDCVEAKDFITGKRSLSLLWHNAKRQGWVAGSNCVGRRSRFTGSIDATIIDVFGNHALSIGRSAVSFTSPSEFNVIERRYDLSYRQLIIVDNRLAGVQLINKIEHAGLLFSTMCRQDDLEELRKVVHDTKLLWQKPWHYWIRHYLG